MKRQNKVSRRDRVLAAYWLPRETRDRFKALAERRGESASGLLSDLLDEVTGCAGQVHEMRYKITSRVWIQLGRLLAQTSEVAAVPRGEEMTAVDKVMHKVLPGIYVAFELNDWLNPGSMAWSGATLVIRCAEPAPKKDRLMAWTSQRLCDYLDGLELAPLDLEVLRAS